MFVAPALGATAWRVGRRLERHHLWRARGGNSIPSVRSQTQFYIVFCILLRIDFSAFGFGHYCATDVLIEEFPLPGGEGWRSHGEMQVPFEENTDGEILLQLRVLDRRDVPNIPLYSI